MYMYVWSVFPANGGTLALPPFKFKVYAENTVLKH